MNATDWLVELGQRAAARLPAIESFHAGDDTLTLAVGTRAVTAHGDGDVILLAPSFSVGGTLGSRLQDRVQHLPIQQYGINEATIDVALDAVLGHLRG